MNKTVVINAVGLTPALLGAATPRLSAFRQAGKLVAVAPVLPALTCSVQSTYLSGTWPDEHGIVGNGWYFRDQCEVRFWHQSNRLVQRPKVWEMAKAKHPEFTCANLFWWFAMYGSADLAVTPRPMYPADGRKIPDLWTQPAELRDELQNELGRFPLFHFWGPAASIDATRWIAEAALRVDRKYDPTLTLIYLPHLDYVLQRHGPPTPGQSVLVTPTPGQSGTPRRPGSSHRSSSPSATDLAELDAICGHLIDHYQQRGASIIVLSEYGIRPVSQPVHLNRVLREHGLLAIRTELARELLDPGRSAAFAVADHQVAHVYVNDPSRIGEVRALLESTPGVARVLDEEGKRHHHLAHPRSGELIALAEAQAWFTYYYWLDDACQPDFARTVDIHRKPGYDPVELFLDPRLLAPKLRIAATLAARKLGFRALLKVTSTDATLVKGSHGLAPEQEDEGAMLMTNRADLLGSDRLQPTDVCGLILRHIG